MSVSRPYEMNHRLDVLMLLTALVGGAVCGAFLFASVAVVLGVPTALVETVMLIGSVIGMIIGTETLYHYTFGHGLYF